MTFSPSAPQPQAPAPQHDGAGEARPRSALPPVLAALEQRAANELRALAAELPPPDRSTEDALLLATLGWDLNLTGNELPAAPKPNGD